MGRSLGAAWRRRVYPQPYRRLAVPSPPHPVRLPYGPHPEQFGELWLPAHGEPAAVCVLVHGGFWREVWRLDLMNALAADLRARGWAAWSIEYRRLGGSGGGWPQTPGDVAGGLAALAQAAQSFPLDLSRVTVLGHSAGAPLAFAALARRGTEPAAPAPALGVRAAVSLAGMLDLEQAAGALPGGRDVVELLGGTPAEVPDRYAQASPAALLPLGVAQLVVHGALDEAVAPSQSADYAARASRLGDEVELLLLKDEGHALLVDPARPHWPTVVAWLEQRL